MSIDVAHVMSIDVVYVMSIDVAHVMSIDVAPPRQRLFPPFFMYTTWSVPLCTREPFRRRSFIIMRV